MQTSTKPSPAQLNRAINQTNNLFLSTKPTRHRSLRLRRLLLDRLIHLVNISLELRRSVLSQLIKLVDAVMRDVVRFLVGLVGFGAGIGDLFHHHHRQLRIPSPRLVEYGVRATVPPRRYAHQPPSRSSLLHALRRWCWAPCCGQR